MADASPERVARSKDGQSWRIGSGAEVEWIARGTATGLAITSAIPPVFDGYATIVIPDDRDPRAEHDRLVLDLLRRQAGNGPWWLGYLDTGSEDIVFPGAPPVSLYAHWNYVLVEAGPDQAARWRDRSWPAGRTIPDLVFPADRSWLLSTLWDDDWRCLGGPRKLIAAFSAESRLEVRVVGTDEDATPPGHQAF
jgi:hypothetical protein